MVSKSRSAISYLTSVLPIFSTNCNILIEATFINKIYTLLHVIADLYFNPNTIILTEIGKMKRIMEYQYLTEFVRK